MLHRVQGRRQGAKQPQPPAWPPHGVPLVDSPPCLGSLPLWRGRVPGALMPVEPARLPPLSLCPEDRDSDRSTWKDNAQRPRSHQPLMQIHHARDQFN